MKDTSKFTKKWITSSHSMNEIRQWITDLKYFKYFRAFGGHMNDGDSFKMCLKFNDANELLEIIDALGFRLNESILIKKNEYDFVTPEYYKIKEYPQFIKPGHQIALDVEWFLWITKNSIIISIAGTGSDNKFEVSTKDFEKCIEFEKLVNDQCLSKNISSEFNYELGCISIENYPDLFKNIN